MKRVLVGLLTIAVIIPAVEWKYEKVYDPTEMNSHGSEITVDGNGTPYILYSVGGSEEPAYILRLAEPDSGGWWITDVDTVPKYKLSFSLDINPDNEIVIAYSDTVVTGISDIYLATYHEGAFDFMNLTDDWPLQLDPIVHVGSDGIVRLVYLEYNDDGTNIRYGWFDGETFVSESIRDSMESHQDGVDFCLDADNNPHVFYTGDDYNLWYATRQGEANWSSTSLEIIGLGPSVAMDEDGYLHIGCQTPPYLNYLTNASGVWTEETVAESEGEMDWVSPTIALDLQETPHMVWYTWMAPFHNQAAALEVWYSSRVGGSWSAREPLPPDQSKAIGNNIFRIDSQGYGHVCYSIYDLYYVKSAEPLGSGINEIPSQVTPVNLEVTGSEVFFNIPVNGFVRLDLYDASGRKVSCLASGNYPAGEYKIPINSGRLAAGVYFVRLEFTGYHSSAKLVITR